MLKGCGWFIGVNPLTSSFLFKILFGRGCLGVMEFLDKVYILTFVGLLTQAVLDRAAAAPVAADEPRRVPKNAGFSIRVILSVSKRLKFSG